MEKLMVLSQITALVILIGFGAAMFMVSTTHRRFETLSLNRFLVADRSVGIWTGAMSVASTWIWAPALFIASQKAYQQGMPGLMWFTVPNVGSLILFAFLAPRIRALFPKGYTLPQYMATRFDSKTHIVYIFCFLALQICSMAVQLIAGGALLHAVGGIPYVPAALILALIFTSYSLIDGLQTSIKTDLIQMGIIILGMLILIPQAVNNGGGFSTICSGFAGFNGAFENLFDPHVAYSFGITVTIGLMSGPVGDQQHWQRAFAFRKDKVFHGYLLGAVIFAVVPLGMSLLGFLAAGNPDAAPAVHAGTLSAQQVGTEVIKTLLPPWGTAIFMMMILAGLASTGDSALCAGGSLVTVDIFRNYMNSDASDERLLWITRVAVVGTAAVAVGIALIPGVTILSLFLFYGTLRSATLMPTIIVLFSKTVSSWGIFWGILLAVAFGLPLYLLGQFSGNIHLKVGANIGILLISLALPMISIWKAQSTGGRS